MNLKKLRPVVGRISRRWKYLTREIFRWLTQRDFHKWQVVGQRDGKNLAVTVVGSKSIYNDVKQIFFQGESAVQVEGPYYRFNAPLSPSGVSGSDVIIGEVAPWRRLLPRASFRFQTLAESTIDLTAGFDAWTKTVNISQVHRYKQSLKLGELVYWAESDEEFRRFYDEFLVPSAVSRHGEQAAIPPVADLLRQRTPRSVLVITDKDGAWLGVGLITKGGGSWKYLRAGLGAAVRSDSKARGRISSRIMFEIAKAAIDEGQKSVNLGLSPAFHNAGIYEFKRQFGAKHFPERLNYPLCFVATPTERGREVLSDLRPYVLRQDTASPYAPRTTDDRPNDIAQIAETQTRAALGRGIVNAAANMGVATAITMALGLLLRLALPRIYGPTQMGQFFFAESLSMLFFCFLPLGLGTYISREVPRDPSLARKILSHIVPAQMALALILGVMVVGYLWATNENATTTLCVLALSAYSAAYVFHRFILTRLYLAIDRSDLIAKVDVATRVGLISLVGIALTFRGSITSIAACFAAAQVGAALWLLNRARRDQFLGDKIDWSFLKSMIVTSLPFFATAAMIEIYGSLDTAMLRYMTSTEEVAFYGAANKLKGAGLAILPILQAALQPALSKAWARDHEGFKLLVSNAMRLLVALSLPMTLVLIALPDVVSGLVFGEAFAPSHMAIACLAPVLVLTYLNVLMGSCLNIIGTGMPFFFVTATSVLMNAILNLVSVPLLSIRFGAGGGAAAAALSTVVSEIFVLLMMRRIFTDGLNFAVLMRRLAIALAPCLAMTLIWSQLLDVNPWIRATTIIIFCPIYIFGTGLARIDDIKWLLHTKFGRDRRQAHPRT